MDGLELLYRGSLKSCNYGCSYCPFSRHRHSGQELSKDQERWEYFVRTVEERAEVLDIRSLLVTPYGEALIHPWYWEGLGRVSALAGIEAAGAQTNLSFQVRESLELFDRAGGDRGKVRLWATFHPEMVSAETFSGVCRQLLSEGVCLCAGGVGVPGNLEALLELRRRLPEEICLWINPMDGLGRPYTEEETKRFLEIDPYFLRELCEVPADPENCRGRLFVEGNGRLRICNISRRLPFSWDGLWERRRTAKDPEGSEDLSALSCGQKRCSCYLAHGGRRELMNRIIFGEHPVFRITRRPRAVFLDIMGTLLPQESAVDGQIPAVVRAGLTGLKREGALLFFATTLPYEKAMERCRQIRHLFSGGVFLGGAHVVLEGEAGGWEQVQGLEEGCLSVLEGLRARMRCRVLAYRRGKELCKVTLLRPGAASWNGQEIKEVSDCLLSQRITKVRVFSERNCLQVAAEHATKENGVRLLCRRLGIRPGEAVSAGDGEEDRGMPGLLWDSMEK